MVGCCVVVVVVVEGAVSTLAAAAAAPPPSLLQVAANIASGEGLPEAAAPGCEDDAGGEGKEDGSDAGNGKEAPGWPEEADAAPNEFCRKEKRKRG